MRRYLEQLVIPPKQRKRHVDDVKRRCLIHREIECECSGSLKASPEQLDLRETLRSRGRDREWKLYIEPATLVSVFDQIRVACVAVLRVLRVRGHVACLPVI